MQDTQHDTPPNTQQDALPASADLWAIARELSAETETLIGSPQDLALLMSCSWKEHGQTADLIRHLERLLRRILVVMAEVKAAGLPPVRERKQTPPPSRGACAPRSTSLSPAAMGEDNSAPDEGNVLHPRSGGRCQPRAARMTEGSEERTRSDATRTTPRPAFNPHAPSHEWRVSFAVIRAPRAPQPYRPSARTRHNRLWREKKARAEALGVRKPYVPPYQPARRVLTHALARRWEAARRVIAGPDPYVIRLAQRLLRIRAANRRSNQKRIVQAWTIPPRRPTQGWRLFSAAILALDQPATRVLSRILDTG